ncbi:hypothetical protein VNI00_018604 [Paramarasmius palmivorus]|uniref:Uncharacterized protein n=1 Tax=Paramarasmius palmivorus TaxID=297713 RepID=A0AAW0AWH9_9AGAR
MGPQDNIQSAGIPEHSETRLPSALDQYHKLKVVDVRLKRKIAETSVERRDKSDWRHVDARRCIHVAWIRGEDRDEEFTHVQYTGPDAMKAYQHDLKVFSTVRDVNWIELFGYIGWTVLPTLVFYDALVPVAHIWERNGFSPMLYTYFCQVAASQGLDEDTGTHSPAAHPDPVDLHSLTDASLLFRYLISTLPIPEIVAGLRWSVKLAPDWPDNQHVKLLLSSLSGTIYCTIPRDPKAIARYPADREKWDYKPLKEQFDIPDTILKDTQILEDGLVRWAGRSLTLILRAKHMDRVMLEQSNAEGLEKFDTHYELQLGRVWNSFADSWLLRAHAIFSQLEIEEDEWDKYSILYNFRIIFERQDEDASSHPLPYFRTDIPIYLFVRPIPRPCDDESEWDAWLGGSKYYWSFDRSGAKEMEESDRLHLQLPLFKATIVVWHASWSRNTYDEIAMIHRSQGFDPASMEPARLLGYSTLEVIDLRSGELDAETTVTSVGAALEEVANNSDMESVTIVGADVGETVRNREFGRVTEAPVRPGQLPAIFRTRFQFIQMNCSMYPYTRVRRCDGDEDVD